MFGIGGSSNKQSTQSDSTGFDISRSYLDPQQLAAQQQLVAQYQQAAPGLGQMPGFDRSQMFSGMGQYASAGQLGGFGQKLGEAAQYGMGQLGQFAGQSNPYLNQQIQGLATDAGRMYREQLLPGIGNQAQLAGQRGSSRQGIAQGLAAQGTMDAFLQQANAMRSGAYGMQQQAATDLAGMSPYVTQAYGAAGDLYGQQGQLANQYAQTNLQAQMMPFQIGSQVIGAPSVLQNSFGYDTSKTRSKGSFASMNI